MMGNFYKEGEKPSQDIVTALISLLTLYVKEDLYSKKKQNPSDVPLGDCAGRHPGAQAKPPAQQFYLSPTFSSKKALLDY